MLGLMEPQNGWDRLTPVQKWEKKAVNWTRLFQVVVIIAAMCGIRAVLTPLVNAWVH